MAAYVDQSADGSTPRVCPLYHQTWWASRAVERPHEHAPRFCPICLSMLGLSEHARAGCRTPQASQSSSMAFPAAAAGGLLKSRAPGGAPTLGPTPLRRPGVGQHSDALGDDLMGAAGLPRLLPSPPLQAPLDQDATAFPAAAGVPGEVRFATKLYLAGQMLPPALAPGVPWGWVTGD